MSGMNENSTDNVQATPVHHPRTSSQSPAQYAGDSFDRLQLLEMETPVRVGTRRRECRVKFTPTLGSSPHVSSETAAVDHNEYSSFGLMNSSFDTLSDGDKTYGVGDESLFSPHNDRLLLRHQSPSLNTGHVNHHEVASDVSIGDISPIKVVYTSNNDGVASYSANSLGDSTRYVQRTQHDTSVIPLEWMQDDADRYNPQGNRSNPVYVLKSSRKAFEKVKYLLPSLGSTMGTCPVNLSDYGNIRQYKEKKDLEGISVDSIVATRRVEASICAFGGTVNRSRNQQTWSIFRHKGDYTEARHEYERALPSRYHVGGSNISWDAEENPPVYNHKADGCSFDTQDARGSGLKSVNSDDETESLTSPLETSPDANTDEALSDAAKMRYKCKLCGQLKQNHVCEYQQALQRSIGVMVYPTVNAFTAAEPGVFTQALTKMNNFVSYYSDQSTLHHGENTPRSTRGPLYPTHPSTITPETPRAGPVVNSPQSSLSAQSSEDPAISGTGQPPHIAKTSSRGWKRSHEHVMDDVHPPFVASVVLRPEQYRAVTPLKKEDTNDDPDAPTTVASTSYQYPVIPLTFAERKRLSDTLFYLSKEIPSMTNDCAAVLRDARQNNEWDLAVAELLTQLVVGLYCSETDARLDGLQQYLLNIGISC